MLSFESDYTIGAQPEILTKLSEINLDKLEIAEHAGIIDFEHGGESSSVLKKLYDIYWTDAIMKKYLSI